MIEKQVPQPKFLEMAEKVSCNTLSDDYVIETVWLEKIEYIITGSMSSGKEGYISIWGYQVVPIEIYKGDLRPLFYSEHGSEVDNGKRDRAYTGQMVKHGKRILVFVGPQITFKGSTQGKQTALF